MADSQVKYDARKFERVWNRSASAAEVARVFGTTPGGVRSHASKLRYQGQELKRMHRGGRKPRYTNIARKSDMIRHSRKDFEAVWQRSDTLADCAAELGWPKKKTSRKACYYRSTDSNLKFFASSGGKQRNQPASMPTLEEIEQLTRKIREEGFEWTTRTGGREKRHRQPPWTEAQLQRKLRADERRQDVAPLDHRPVRGEAMGPKRKGGEQ
jgi:hypothetical protein